MGIVVQLGVSTQNAVVGEEDIQDNLCVESPISRVIIHEDGINFETRGGVFGVDRAGERPRMTSIVVEEVLSERPDSGVRGYYISRSDDAAKSISSKSLAWSALGEILRCERKKEGC